MSLIWKIMVSSKSKYKVLGLAGNNASSTLWSGRYFEFPRVDKFFGWFFETLSRVMETSDAQYQVV